MTANKDKDSEVPWGTLIFMAVVILIFVGGFIWGEHSRACEPGFERVSVGNVSGCISYETILEEINE